VNSRSLKSSTPTLQSFLSFSSPSFSLSNVIISFSKSQVKHVWLQRNACGG
jgi:hypothetical protein